MVLENRRWKVSVIVARGADGALATYPCVRNEHANHILDVSTAPAGLAPEVEHRAQEVARATARALDLVGLICVELFVLPDGRVLVNEIAPRPHNSGHLTIEACATSQFEQQVRALCGLPLGDTALERPAAMANLLGDLWSGGEPRWDRALEVPGPIPHPGDEQQRLRMGVGVPDRPVGRDEPRQHRPRAPL